MSKSLATVKSDLKEVMELVKSEFGVDYSKKNPGLVQFLMDKIQQEKDRKVTRAIHKVAAEE